MIVGSGADVGAGLLPGLREAALRIDGLPADVDHASGGPLHQLGPSDLMVLVYHGEHFQAGNARIYRSFLGLAVSRNGGQSFRDLGQIVTPEWNPGRTGLVEVGSGATIVRDGVFDVYFQEKGSRSVARNLSVARASVREVTAAAANGEAPRFMKYSDGSFEQPGLGGASAELFDSERGRAAWFDTVFLEPLGHSALVFSTVERVIDGLAHWNHCMSLSEDGIRWSDPVRLWDEPQPAEMIYVTLDSGEEDQRVSTTGSFDLFRTWSTTPFRWDDARLERIRVDVEPATV